MKYKMIYNKKTESWYCRLPKWKWMLKRGWFFLEVEYRMRRWAFPLAIEKGWFGVTKKPNEYILAIQIFCILFTFGTGPITRDYYELP